MTSFTTSPARRPTIRPPAYKHDGDMETWAAAARWRYFHAPAIGDPAIGIAHRSRGTVVCVIHVGGCEYVPGRGAV